MALPLQLLLIFLLSASLTGAWLVLARRRRWLVPPNSRSSHRIPVPSGGGVGFVLISLLYICWLRQAILPGWQGLLVLAGAVVLALTGLLDDFRNLGIRLRLALQVVAIVALMPFLFGMPPLVFFDITIDSGVLALLLGAGLLWHINLYNFMDGIDALASMQAIFFCVAVSLLAGLAQSPAIAVMLALGAAVCGFLLYNLPRARLFMGDAGSYFLGYMLVIMALVLVKEGKLQVWSVLVLAGTFIADSTTTLLGRMRQRAVWYHAHRTHAYQLLAIRWKSHGSVVAIYTAINVLWLLPLAWLTLRKPELGLMLTLLAWSPLVVLFHAVRKKLGTAAG